ncbi:E3 ubiquitin-protein ligase RNF180 [Halyomorpha halys]|uniref:E3 ubiquitin-protein ligase RNF180 n=1 Tax=Halyomorpha halys TaxID=286706 RepID=UPI000D0C8703|nr:E3 ubiquitin-protein ligase RNF180-like [Halyomorpha halys]
MSQIVLKCRQCRQQLLDSSISPILSGHNLVLNAGSITYPNLSDCEDVISSLYIEETAFPEWILSSVDEAGWKKGKVKCPKCSSRVGSFDFVSGRKCKCNENVLPPLHLIKSKVDFQIIET